MPFSCHRLRVMDALLALLMVDYFAPTVRAATCWANLPKAQFPNCQLVSLQFAVHWTQNGSAITFGLDVDVPSNSNSWIGLGISEHGGMFGGDLWLLRKDVLGAYYIQDSYSSGPNVLNVDTQQDLTLLSAPPPSNNNTVFTFIRALKTCDSMDMEILQGYNHHVVWAYGSSQSSVSYHGPNQRGDAGILFYPNAQKSLAAIRKQKAALEIQNLATNSNLLSYAATFPNHTVSPAKTTYFCTHIEVPRDQKYHIVQYEAILTSSIIHHMILYGCTGKPQAFRDQYDCLSMEPLCSQAALVWTPGAGMTVYPVEAGLPIGPGGFEYFSLQIHYNNPNGLSNVIDSSGFKFYYTSVLRKYDIGLLLVGQFDLTIPGDSSSYTNSDIGICPSSCTSKFPNNMTIISNLLHMHTLGFNISTRQIRGSQEIIPLGERHYYDFSYQGVSPPTDPNAVVAPGDTLLTRCTYKPTAGIKKNVTIWGENTSDEMCLNYITYYPRNPKVSVCYAATANYALCSTDAWLSNATNTADLIASGDIVPYSMPTFTPYVPPMCQKSFALMPQPPTLNNTLNATVVTQTKSESPKLIASIAMMAAIMIPLL
ncbi:PHM/PNGase F domain-containing protein [Chytriomyces sp. MP71]|nr:PHM/PNGase F domain-containing protein [Chytriomyces sp. MP71]